MYIDYSNVYSGARDAFILDRAPGYRGNVNPMYLAKRVALHSPHDASSRRDTHELTYTKVFRGAPDPGRDPRGALMEAKRAAQWEAWGATVLRHTLDYGQGRPVEKGVDVRIATEMIRDSALAACDVMVIVSADKDFRYALLNIRDMGGVQIEVATWQAVPGGMAVGRIELKPERPDEDEVPCHLLQRQDFGKLEDKIDYRGKPVPPNWRGPTPTL